MGSELRSRDLGKRAGPIVDLDDQIHRHELPPVSRGVILSLPTTPVAPQTGRTSRGLTCEPDVCARRTIRLTREPEVG